MTRQPDTNSPGIEFSRIWQIGLLAIVASVIANLVVRALALALVELPAGFLPLQVGSITTFTVVGTLAGVIVFAVIGQIVERPIRTFTIIAVIALFLSIIPNIALAADPSAAPMPGGTSSGFLVLIVFHIVAGAITIWLLTTQTVER